MPGGVAPFTPETVADLRSRAAVRWAPLALAAAVPSLLFLALPPLSRSGLWDPYELSVAELGRRIGCNLFGGSALALPGADNSMPHLNDLGRPELPFTSIGLGLRLFGLHEWAGRLPMALWGIVGALATYAFVARLFDRRAGVYASVVLATTPVYFVHARTMLGDVCTMAGLAMAFGGFAVSAFDRDEAGAAPFVRRLPWMAMGALGLLVGFESRGALLGIAVPLLGVGLAWMVSRVGARTTARYTAGDAIGGVCLVAGVAVAARVALSFRSAPGAGGLDPWIGVLVHAPDRIPTYDFYIGVIGHALAPWSAFLPFAFGRLLVPPAGRTGHAAERESMTRVALLLGASVTLVAQGLLASRSDPLPFVGAPLCAAACAVAIRDLERGAHASTAIAVGTLILAAVLHHDFHEQPTKAFAAFGVAGASFPQSFEPRALTLWWIALGGFAVCAFLTWVERDARRTPFDAATYAQVLGAFRRREAPIALFHVAVLSGAALAGLAVVVGLKLHAHWVAPLSSTVRAVLLNAWWVLAVVPPGAVFGLLFVCDVWLWAFGDSRPASSRSLTRWIDPYTRLRAQVRGTGGDAWVARLVLAPLMISSAPLLFVMGLVGDAVRRRAAALAVGGAGVGLLLCVSYYPALAGQLSPKEIFDTYRRDCAGAPLAMLGVSARAAPYYAGGQPVPMTDAQAAYRWLTSGAGERRCLATTANELPKLNALWREHAKAPAGNIPVLDARSSEILLLASSLRDGEQNHDPLSSIVLETDPRPRRRLDANLGDELLVLGTDVLDDRRRPVDAVVPGRSYRLVVTYRVLGRVSREWQPFVHVDGNNRRHNGDHAIAGGKYPMSLWQPGDVIADESELKLEPNFTPGTYTLWFGLAVGDRCSDRLAVKSGPSDGCNRVDGGPLRVQ